EAAERAAQDGKDLEGVLEAAVAGAKEALARTPSLLPVLARAGVVDAGAQGFVFFLEGILAAVRGQVPVLAAPASPGVSGVTPAPAALAGAQVHSAITHEFVEHRYCTEFLIRGSNLDLDEIQRELEPLGDSLLVVGDSELVKVHVHTNHPGRALEIGTARGELLNVSVANMQEQNRVAASHDQAESPGAVAPVHAVPERVRGTAAAQEPRADAHQYREASSPGTAVYGHPGADGLSKEIGVVAVAQGDGWRQLL